MSFLRKPDIQGNLNFKQIGQIIQEVSDDLYEPEYTRYPYDTVKILDVNNQTDEYGKVPENFNSA